MMRRKVDKMNENYGVGEKLNRIMELFLDYLETEYKSDERLEELVKKFFRENGHVFRIVRGW